MTQFKAGLAGIFLALGMVTSACAEEVQNSGDEVKVSTPKKKARSKAKADKAGVKIRIDDVRAEWGSFTDKPAASDDAWLHGAASVKSQSGVWELALGVRFDAYGQSGTPGFSRTQLDYTENYLRWRGENMRVTVGTQNVLWGRVDEISPIDRMSRADLSRIILDKLPERRRAVPAVRLEHFSDEAKVDAVWLPVFDAAVMPHENSVWHPVDTVNGRLPGIGSVPGIIGARVNDDEHGSGGAGVRITRSGGKLDYGFSLQRVRQSQPYYRVEPGQLIGVHPFSWIGGGELEMQKGGATWRMEAAWSSDVPVTTTAFQYRTERAFDIVLGTEFFPGDSDTRATVQLAGHKTFADVPIMDRDKFYNLNGELEHPFALGRWRANLRFAAGLDKSDLYLNPRLSYLGIDRHEIYVAAHLFSGAPQTLGGYYQQNDMVVLGWQAKF